MHRKLKQKKYNLAQGDEYVQEIFARIQMKYATNTIFKLRNNRNHQLESCNVIQRSIVSNVCFSC